MPDPTRRIWQLVEHGGRLSAQSVYQEPADGDQQTQYQCRTERSRNPDALEHADDRIERVVDQHAEDNRDQHRLRVLQHQNDGDDRQDGQRRAANIDLR